MLTRKQARDQRLSSGSDGNQTTKRAAESSPPTQQPLKKRSALGDITNDLRKVQLDSSKKQLLKTAVTTMAIDNQSLSSSSTAQTAGGRKVEITTFAAVALDLTMTRPATMANTSGGAASASDVSMLSTVDEIVQDLDELQSDQSMATSEGGDGPAAAVVAMMPMAPGFGIRTVYDRENEKDPYNVPHYAQDIFDYYRARETHFLLGDYMDRDQSATDESSATGITRQMRAILVDWMVEVQESFELNHETLYQAVKMTDLYLEKARVGKDTLQLVGATAIFIASKFDERQPPLIDDMLYICDDAYTRKQITEMEECVLKKLKFDIGYPLSYRFLRRYAKATKADITTLTLARYVLEMSLMHFEMMLKAESQLAAAAFLLAIRMKNDVGGWTQDHAAYSGYEAKDLDETMWQLNGIIKGTELTKKLKNIRAKYSHEVFHSVAEIAPLDRASVPQIDAFGRPIAKIAPIVSAMSH